MGEEDKDYNRTYAVDGKWGIGKKATISGFYAQTQTPDTTYQMKQPLNCSRVMNGMGFAPHWDIQR